MLSFIAALMFFVAPAPPTPITLPPAIIAATPVVVDGHLYAAVIFNDGTYGLADEVGITMISDTDGAEGEKFQSSYKDKDGITHTVVTPIPGVTKGSRDGAFQRHQAALALMVSAYPPVP